MEHEFLRGHRRNIISTKTGLRRYAGLPCMARHTVARAIQAVSIVTTECFGVDAYSFV